MSEASRRIVAAPNRGSAQRAPEVRLLERADALAQLAEAVSRLAAGEGGILLIEGAPGVGKTTLLEELCSQAQDASAVVLRATASTLERAHTFGIVRQLLEGRLMLAGSQRTDLISGAAELALPAVGHVDQPEQVQPSHAVLHGLYWLTVNLSSRGALVLACDDLHWADEASLRYFGYLAKRIAGLPVLAAFSCWPPSASVEGPERLLRDLAHAREATVITPKPFSPLATRAFVSAHSLDAPADRFVDTCQALTGGNPAMLSELLRTLQLHGLPATAASLERLTGSGEALVERTVLARLDALSPASRALAHALAILTADAPLRRAAVLAGLTSHTAAQAADELTRAQVLEPGRPLTFTHLIVRQAVLSELGSAERSRLHREAAELLVEEHEPPDHVAAHLLEVEAAGDRSVVEWLQAAAGDASSRGDPSAAVEYLKRALAEPPPEGLRMAVLRELGAAESRAGTGEPEEHLEAAFQLARDPVERAGIAISLSQVLLWELAPGRALDVLERAIDHLPEGERPLGLRLEVEHYVAGSGALRARLRVRKRVPRFAPDVRRIDEEGERLALAAVAGERLLSELDRAAASELAGRVLNEGQLFVAEGTESPAVYIPIATLIYAGELDRARRGCDTAADIARSRGSMRGFAMACTWRSLANFRIGALRQAEADARAVLDAEPEAGATLGGPIALSILAEIEVERGAPEAALSLVPFEPPTAPELPVFVTFLPYAVGRARLANGDAAGALALFDACIAHQSAWEVHTPMMVPAMQERALAQLALGSREEARASARQALQRAERLGASAMLGRAMRVLGSVCGDVDVLERAVELLERSPAKLELAYALTELGSYRRRARQRSSARQPLLHALDIAQRCGASGLAQRAHRELVAAGGRPRRVQLSGRDALTAAELQVAEHAAAGMSNREIAQALFVTLRTVETHLTSAYRKLGISSRGELDAALSAEPAS